MITCGEVGTDACSESCPSIGGTYCIENESACPTTQEEIDNTFDAGTGGSWDVKINGGFTDVSLICEKGYRPEIFGQQVSKCHNGAWVGTLTRCIEDKDYCQDNHPQNLDKTVINGEWVRFKIINIETGLIIFSGLYEKDRNRRRGCFPASAIWWRQWG